MAFRWLCQLKIAPYSYDLIDKRRSMQPRSSPGAEELSVSQQFLVFTLTDTGPSPSPVSSQRSARTPGWLVIRGISDLADHTKTYDHQHSAAHNAATTLQHLIPYLPAKA